MSWQKIKYILREILVTLLVWGAVTNFIGRPSYVPTGSMEKKILIGDVVWVTPLYHKGPRIPRVISLPFMQRYIWGTKIPAYIKIPFMPHVRLKFLGLIKMKRGDTMVFNAPVAALSADEKDCPIDVRQPFVKELKALPGDFVELRNGVLYVNGKQDPEYRSKKAAQEIIHRHLVITKRSVYQDFFMELGFQKKDIHASDIEKGHYLYLTKAEADKLAKHPIVRSVKQAPIEDRDYFYNSRRIQVPYIGMKVKMNKQACRNYGALICECENLKEAEIKEGTLYIKGKKVEVYTFKQDYYFPMGLNRDRSHDGRGWEKGVTLSFVPDDHIIGKAPRILLGLDPNKVQRKSEDTFRKKLWFIDLLLLNFSRARSWKKT